jgi:hypothetical protein
MGNPIAWLETVAVRLGLLMLLQIGATPRMVFIVHTDNTTTQSAILLRKSGNVWVNHEWKAIQHLLLEADIDLKVQRVTLAENCADLMSRGKTGWHLRRDALRIQIPDDLQEFIAES